MIARKVKHLLLYWIGLVCLQAALLDAARQGRVGDMRLIAISLLIMVPAGYGRLRLKTSLLVLAAPIGLFAIVIGSMVYAESHHHRPLVSAALLVALVSVAVAFGVDMFLTIKRPNQPPEPTVMSVTPPAAQEPRQP